MKIYYASQSFYPHIGGVSTYLLNLQKEMVKRGNDVVEVHLRPSGEFHEDEISGIEVHRVPKTPIDKELMKSYSRFKEAVYTECHYNKKAFTKKPAEMEGYEAFNEINEFFGEELKALLEEDPADIVHIHDFQLLFAYKYVPRGTPCVFTWHIPFFEGMSKPLSDFLIKNMDEYDKVVFSSPEYIEAVVKAGLPREKTELIYPIANTELFRVMDVDRIEVRKRYNIPAGSKVILCVQRIDPKSGHIQLINAMPEILKRIPDAKLVFVGAESLSNKLSKDREALAKEVKDLVKKLNLENDVLFTGNIDYNDLPELYNSADIVALCSKNEGFGLSVTEGMACGKPVIGNRVGGIPLQVKDGVNGFLVEVGDSKATSKRIISMLSDSSLMKRMSENSLKIVDEKFRIEKGVEKHAILYNQLIDIKDEFHKIEYMHVDEIKGFITDLDRTITEKACKPDFDPVDYDTALLDELKSLDIDLFLSTGRNIHYVRKLCSRFNIWRCVIAENGAVIYFPRTRKTISINTSYMTRCKKIIRDMGLPETVVGKIIVSIKSVNEDKVRHALGKYADKVRFVRNVDETMIIPDGVDKGIGIVLAMKYLNIDMDKTIMMGDAENDIEMFLNPGFKVAVANADEKLKKLANLVTKEPSAEGVREVIRKLRLKTV